MPDMPGLDHDGDGDYDQFDAAVQDILDNPENSLGRAQEEIADLALGNALHEFFEDIGELYDGNPNNDSFTDGGNGSGNQTPLEPGYSPGGGIPVILTFGDFTYSFADGNFSIISGPGGGGGDGFAPF